MATDTDPIRATTFEKVRSELAKLLAMPAEETDAERILDSVMGLFRKFENMEMIILKSGHIMKETDKDNGYAIAAGLIMNEVIKHVSWQKEASLKDHDIN